MTRPFDMEFFDVMQNRFVFKRGRNVSLLMFGLNYSGRIHWRLEFRYINDNTVPFIWFNRHKNKDSFELYYVVIKSNIVKICNRYTFFHCSAYMHSIAFPWRLLYLYPRYFASFFWGWVGNFRVLGNLRIASIARNKIRVGHAGLFPHITSLLSINIPFFVVLLFSIAILIFSHSFPTPFRSSLWNISCSTTS